jgi:hypothetical protein
MMANLTASLIAAEAIETTEAKAKALRPIAEKLITKAKKGGVHRHRQVVSFMGDKEMASKLFSDIAPRYDLLNHVLSLNIDKGWRRRALTALGWTMLDRKDGYDLKKA